MNTTTLLKITAVLVVIQTRGDTLIWISQGWVAISLKLDLQQMIATAIHPEMITTINPLVIYEHLHLMEIWCAKLAEQVEFVEAVLDVCVCHFQSCYSNSATTSRIRTSALRLLASWSTWCSHRRRQSQCYVLDIFASDIGGLFISQWHVALHGDAVIHADKAVEKQSDMLVCWEHYGRRIHHMMLCRISNWEWSMVRGVCYKSQQLSL
jgi:hypothetical protein